MKKLVRVLFYTAGVISIVGLFIAFPICTYIFYNDYVGMGVLWGLVALFILTFITTRLYEWAFSK